MIYQIYLINTAAPIKTNLITSFPILLELQEKSVKDKEIKESKVNSEKNLFKPIFVLESWIYWTYEGFHHTTAAPIGPPLEPESLREVTEDDLEPAKHQSMMMNYIGIQDIYRVRIRKKKKTIKKKYKKAKLTNYG